MSSDIGVSEAALYRHFKNKNEIMLGLLTYFMQEMNERLMNINSKKGKTPIERLRGVFSSQLKTFTQKPAIVSVIFSDGIFRFNKKLSSTVSDLIDMMHNLISGIVKEGQADGSMYNLVGHSTLATIILGSMRITVLKWKISDHTSDLIKDGNNVLNGILKMIQKQN